MATYDNLPVYKACYSLLLLLFNGARNMQRDYRYTLGETMKNELIALITNIYRANCRIQKKRSVDNSPLFSNVYLKVLLDDRPKEFFKYSYLKNVKYKSMFFHFIRKSSFLTELQMLFLCSLRGAVTQFRSASWPLYKRYC